MRLLIGALSIALLAGCQTTSRHAGEGPLRLTHKTALAAEKFLNSNNGVAFAVTTSGTRSMTTNCNFTRCDYQGKTPQGYTIERCQRSGQECGIFAVGKSIIWNGPVFIQMSTESHYVVRLRVRNEDGSGSTFTGSANPIPDDDNIMLRIYYNRQKCIGKADASSERWSLECGDVRSFAGRIEPGTESTYWGISDAKHATITIDEYDLSTLREKLSAHQEQYR